MPNTNTKRQLASKLCASIALKNETKIVRYISSSNQPDYDGKLVTPTANIVTAKCHINSPISMPGAKCCIMDIKDFYLGTLMTKFDYLRVSLSTFPT